MEIKYDAFISYKRNGGAGWAALIYNIMNQIHHLNLWLDVETMHGGPWDTQISEAILSSRCVIMILFPNIEKELVYESDDIFLKEIEFAYSNKIPIIPFIAYNCQIDDFLNSAKLPIFLRHILTEGRQHCNIRYNHSDIESTFDNLYQQLSPKLEIKITSQDADCDVCLEAGIHQETKFIKKGTSHLFKLSRNFVGEAKFYCHKKTELEYKMQSYDLIFPISQNTKIQAETIWDSSKLLTKEWVLNWSQIERNKSLDLIATPLNNIKSSNIALSMINQILAKV